MVMKGLCCWGTDYCKCQVLGLIRNQNVKLGYFLLLFVVLGTSFIFGLIKSDS